jgi:hypothetical protein
MLEARDEMLASANRRDGVLHALMWVSQHYTKQTDQWVNDVWLADLSDEQRQGIVTADSRIRSIHDINLLEQLVAEGQYSESDGDAGDDAKCELRPLQLILGAVDLELDEAQRSYLEQLAERSLRLYEVTACAPGESFTVRDALQSNAEAVVIEDECGSRMMDVADVVGLRLMQTSAGWETSGAVYHIPDDYRADLESLLQEASDAEFSVVLIQFWLKLVAAHV